jgi:putative acetyltransferase
MTPHFTLSGLTLETIDYPEYHNDKTSLWYHCGIIFHFCKNMQNLSIKEAYSEQLDTILQVEQAAFASDVTISTLVSELLTDPTAQPTLSLLAFQEKQAIGHILFSKAQLDSAPSVPAAILAPLAVLPSFQNQGIGRQLVQTGLQMLTDSKVALVFVLGYPVYYARFGFQTASLLGFTASYPILDKNIDAWMVKDLNSNIIGKVSGKVLCANTLDKPEYWIE